MELSDQKKLNSQAKNNSDTKLIDLYKRAYLMKIICLKDSFLILNIKEILYNENNAS